MFGWKLENSKIKEIQESLKQKQKQLKEKLEQKNKLSVLKQELSAYEIEYSHHLKYVEQFNVKNIPYEIANIKSADTALEMSFFIEIADEEYKNKFIEFIKTVIEFLKIKKFKRTVAEQLLKKYSKDCLIALYQKRFYEINISKKNSHIEKLENELNSFDFNKKMKEYTELSTQIFKAKLAKKYTSHTRQIYTIDELQTKSEDFIKNYPVILSTAYSLRTCLSEDVMYDYVIVDEASQVDLCTGVLALSCAKNASRHYIIQIDEFDDFCEDKEIAKVFKDYIKQAQDNNITFILTTNNPLDIDNEILQETINIPVGPANKKDTLQVLKHYSSDLTDDEYKEIVDLLFKKSQNGAYSNGQIEYFSSMVDVSRNNSLKKENMLKLIQASQPEITADDISKFKLEKEKIKDIK